MSEDNRIIAFHATQYWENGRNWSGFILLSPEECEKLESSLRLARTGKLGMKKPVVAREHVARGFTNAIKRTSFTMESYIPGEDS